MAALSVFCSSLLSFAANVANLTLFRFAGRPGKYNKLFNRWRLEEVSAIRHHPKWVIIPAMTGLIIAFCLRLYLEFSSHSSFLMIHLYVTM